MLGELCVCGIHFERLKLGKVCKRLEPTVASFVGNHWNVCGCAQFKANCIKCLELFCEASTTTTVSRLSESSPCPSDWCLVCVSCLLTEVWMQGVSCVCVWLNPLPTAAARLKYQCQCAERRSLRCKVK